MKEEKHLAIIVAQMLRHIKHSRTFFVSRRKYFRTDYSISLICHLKLLRIEQDKADYKYNKI